MGCEGEGGGLECVWAGNSGKQKIVWTKIDLNLTRGVLWGHLTNLILMVLSFGKTMCCNVRINRLKKLFPLSLR